MINFNKNHSKKHFIQTISKKFLLTTSLIIGILFFNQAFSIAKTGISRKISDAATLTVNLQKTDNPCQGRSIGTITTTVSGGIEPYTYLWNDASTTQNRANLPSGTYSVTVTDFLGATGTSSITLVDPQPILINGAGLNQIKCNGGKGDVFINPTGGTPPYKYFWTKRGTFVTSNKDIIQQDAGTYDITVTDSGIGNCSSSTNFTLVEPNPIGITESSRTNNVEFGDSNGAIVLNITGGKPGVAPSPAYTYLWNDGITTKDRSGLGSGTYSVTVTDENNCTKPFISEILPSSKFTVTDVLQNNKCSGTPNGSITITSSGGIAPYKFKWADQASFVASPDRSGLSGGTYTLTAQDNNGIGAIRTLTFTITDPLPLTFTVNPTNNICFSDNKGKIDLVANGGLTPYSYILDATAPVSFPGTTFTITNLTSGTHSVTIIDANNCMVTPSKSVDILPMKALAYKNAPTIFKVRCSDNASGSIKVDIIDGNAPYTYKWSNDATNNTPQDLNLTVGDYFLDVSDASGCTLPQQKFTVTREAPPISLTENPLLHVDNVCFNNPDKTVIKNGKATINISGGSPNYTANWTFEGNPITLIDLDPTQNRISVADLPSGTYTLMVVDMLGCNSPIQTIEITPLKKIITNPIISNEKCIGSKDGSIEIIPTGGNGGYKYSWDSPQFIGVKITSKIEPLNPGIYNLRIIDSKLCQFDTTFVVKSAVPVTVVDSVIEKANICVQNIANGSAKITVKGGVPPYTAFNFSILEPTTGTFVPLLPATIIDPNSPNVAFKDLLAPGDYILSVIDQNACPSNIIKFKVNATNCNPANDKLIVDPLFSPNDDGRGNNFFYINKIEDYPENEVIIYNRWGMEVFTVKGYNNADKVFRGVANSNLTNKNEVLVDGVYYYTIRSVVDKKPRINKGYVILKR
jgi:hypothetical protein